MANTVIVENRSTNLLWVILALILFILLIVFLAYTIYYAARDNVVNTAAQTNFQQPIFSNTQIVYPTQYNGIPSSNTYDLPTARLAVAASQSASNLIQNANTFVPLSDFTPVGANGITPLLLIKNPTGVSPYDLVVAYPDQNFFTYADNGPWNQTNWFSMGNVHNGMNQLAATNLNNVVSAVNKVPPNGNTLVTGHGAGAGAAILAAMRLKQINPGFNIIVYVSGCPKIGDNVWFDNLINNSGLFNIFWLINSSDNITANPLPIMVNSLNDRRYGYTLQFINGRTRTFTYQNLDPTNNHSIATYAYALDPATYPEPYSFSWPFVPIG